MGYATRIVRVALAAAVVTTIADAIAQGPRPSAATIQGEPTTIRVGPTHPVRSIAQAAKLSRQGDVIEIEAGEYPGDVAVLDKSDLVVRGVNGKPRLVANGKSAEGKGILVVRAENIVIENLAFIGAKVAHSTGPAALLLPLRGVSAIDREGQPFDDPEARRALYAGIREHHGKIELLELDCHVNDPEFAAAAARKLLALMGDAEKNS